MHLTCNNQITATTKRNNNNNNNNDNESNETCFEWFP